MLAFSIFLIGYVLSQFYRSFLAVIAPELSADLTLTPADLGLISASWFAAFAAVQFPVGAALDSHGPRRTLPVLMLAGVAGALLFARATDASDAMAAMALIGVGCSGALMGPLFVFAHTSAPRRFALLSALMIGLGSLGNLLGGTPLALAAEVFGWRGVFMGLAAVTLAAAVLVFLLISDPPAAETHTHDDGSILSGLKETLSLRALWPVWPLMTIAYGILITERGLWVGPFLSQVHGLDPIARGNVIFLMAAAIGIGALAYGPLEGWIGRRKGLNLGGSLITAAAFLLLAFWPQAPLATATAILVVLGLAGMTYGPLMAHVRLFLPARLLGRGMTFANFLCMSGAGALQIWSGRYVQSLGVAGLPPAEQFAYVHLALGLILLAAAAIYAFAREAEAAPQPGPAAV